MPEHLLAGRVSPIERSLNIAVAMRYLTVVGFTLLVQNHIATFRDEINLIWRSPHSIPKYAWILNRYLVPSCLIVVLTVISGFYGSDVSTETCRRTLFGVAVCAITSLGIGHGLVLLRVRVLWDRNRLITLLLASGFMLSFSTTFTLNVIATVHILPGIRWNPIANQCVATEASRFLVIAWAAPLIFELLVLGATVMNAVSRPRVAHQPLARALHQDGILFFLTLASLRALNLGLASTLDPALTFLCLYFVWALVTLVLNRSILSLRRAEISTVTLVDDGGLELDAASRLSMPKISPVDVAYPRGEDSFLKLDRGNYTADLDITRYRTEISYTR